MPTRNNPQTSYDATNTNSYTLASYAAPSGSDRALVVRVHGVRGTTVSFTPSVTYGGISLTQAATIGAASANRYYRTVIFYLLNPTVGTADIVVTTPSLGGMLIEAETLTGVNQTTPIGVTATSTNALTSTYNLTGCSAGSLVLAAVTSNAQNSPTWEWDTATEDYDERGGQSAVGEVAGAGGHYAVAGAGDVSFMSTRSVAAETQVAVAVEFLAGAQAIEVSIVLGASRSASFAPVRGVPVALSLGRSAGATSGSPQMGAGAALTLGRGLTTAPANSAALTAALLEAISRDLSLIDEAAAGGETTIEVGTGSDDGHEATGGAISLTAQSLDLDSVGDHMAFIFRSLPIPPGATITACHIEVYPNDAGRHSPNLTIRGEAMPANLSTSSGNISGRTKTTASVQWVATNIGTGAYKASPSLTAVMQEMVDDGDWTNPGNAGIFFAQNGASGWFRVAAYDNITYPQARLYIAWSSGLAAEEGVALGRSSGVGLDSVAAVGDGLALGRSLTTMDAPLGALAAAVALGQQRGMAQTALSAMVDALDVGRQLDIGPEAIAEAAAALELSWTRDLAVVDALTVAEALLLARALALDLTTGAPPVAETVTLARLNGIATDSSMGVGAALALTSALGLTSADGLTTLEALALTRALGLSAAAELGATAQLILSLTLGLAAGSAADMSAALSLGLGRGVDVSVVGSYQDALALTTARGASSTAGLLLTGVIALAVARGLDVGLAFGEAAELALGRVTDIDVAEGLLAEAWLALARGEGVSAEALVDALGALALERIVGVQFDGTLALLEAVGIHLYRGVLLDETTIVAVTRRHVFVIDSEKRVWVIPAEARLFRIGERDDER
jgi:hypothetical protein